MNLILLPVAFNENIRCYVDLAEDKKETDMNTSVNSRDCSWIEH